MRTKLDGDFHPNNHYRFITDKHSAREIFHLNDDLSDYKFRRVFTDKLVSKDSISGFLLVKMVKCSLCVKAYRVTQKNVIQSLF